MHPGEVAFGDQLCLRRQPMLHLVPGPRTLVDIAEVSFSCHLVRGRCKVAFIPIGCGSYGRSCWLGQQGWWLRGFLVVFHK